MCTVYNLIQNSCHTVVHRKESSFASSLPPQYNLKLRNPPYHASQRQRHYRRCSLAQSTSSGFSFCRFIYCADRSARGLSLNDPAFLPVRKSCTAVACTARRYEGRECVRFERSNRMKSNASSLSKDSRRVKGRKGQKKKQIGRSKIAGTPKMPRPGDKSRFVGTRGAPLSFCALHPAPPSRLPLPPPVGRGPGERVLENAGQRDRIPGTYSEVPRCLDGGVSRIVDVAELRQRRVEGKSHPRTK